MAGTGYSSPARRRMTLKDTTSARSALRGQYVPPAQPRDRAANPSQAVGRPVPASSPEKPARRVELAALTTSGVSGLTVDRGSSGRFDVYAATQVGLQHAKGGYPREDAYAIGGAAEQHWVFLAVADGLGCRPRILTPPHSSLRRQS